MTTETFPSEIAIRFWSRTDRNGDCWNWTGATSSGYGSLRIHGRTYYAHRVAFELTHRKLQVAEHVIHTCDNPRCCNPAHLRAGSHADNMADMAAKGRSRGGGPSGSRQGSAKLNESQVISIRQRYNGKNRQQLAREYGVTPQTINYVISKGWRHVNV